MANQKLIMEQYVDTVKSFVQMFVDSFKSDLKELREENNELKRSLEYSQEEIADLKKTAKQQADLIKKMGDVQGNFGKLEENVRRMDDYGRRGNLIIDGLEESVDENPEQTQHKVQTFIKEKLSIPVQLESANRLGGNSQSTSTSIERNSKPRMIIARFGKISERQNVMKSSAKLKGTNVFLNDDVCRTTMDIRRQKMNELKDKRKQGYIAYFSGSEIKVVGRRQNKKLSEQHGDGKSSILSGGNMEPLVNTRVLRSNSSQPDAVV